MRYIDRYIPGQYAGIGYSTASRKALEICEIAAESGQTLRATKHLAELSAIMTSFVPEGVSNSYTQADD